MSAVVAMLCSIKEVFIEISADRVDCSKMRRTVEESSGVFSNKTVQ